MQIPSIHYQLCEIPSSLFQLHRRHLQFLQLNQIVLMANTTTDLARPVHWQSAFWGLAAIGFNTAIQDSGSVLGLSKDHRMALRTSPLICLFDTVQVLLAFAVHCSHHPPREAIRLVAKGRLVEEAASAKSNPGQCMLTWASRVIALLQVVKIFSLSGLPWTQVFATFFFASYVIQEIVNRFGETKKEHTPASSSQLENGHMQAKITASTPDPVAAPARDTLRLVVKKSAFAFQILLWMWLLGGPFHRDDRSAYGIFSHTIPLITAVAPAIPLWTPMACLCVGALVLALLADVFCTVVAWAAATYFLSGLADHPTQWWRRYLLNSISILIAIAVAIAQSKLFVRARGYG